MDGRQASDAGEAVTEPATFTSSPFAAHRDTAPSAQPSLEEQWAAQENSSERGGGAPHAILVAAQARLKEGSHLWDDVQLGRLLGAGVQARVFELVYSDGRTTGKVLKINHADLGHKLINNPVIWIPLEREWELGTQLRAALEDPDGTLNGFMRVEDCLVKADMSQGTPTSARFAGMTMEKLNGWEVYKRIDDPAFHNIHYVREMLFQVLSALDVAQRKLGFHHADLGMRNVMEHFPVLWEEVEAEQQAKNIEAKETGAREHVQHSARATRYEASPGALPAEQERQLTGAPKAAPPAVTVSPVPAGSSGGAVAAEPAAPAAGATPAATAAGALPAQGGKHPRVERVETPPPDSSHPPPPPVTVGRRSKEGCIPVRPRPGFSCNSDGTRTPLGPLVAFKIIDFGVAAFNETLAQAAGGDESKGVMARLQQVFGAKCITYDGPPPSQHKPSISMQTSEQAVPGRGAKKDWHLLPTGGDNIYLVKQTPVGAHPVCGASAASSLTASTLLTLQQQQGGDVAIEVNPELAEKGKPPPQPAMSPVEKMYRQFWKRKGDVFHLLLGLALSLDDRVWPKEDEADVNKFLSLVHHVTGLELRASFAVEAGGRSEGLFGYLYRQVTGPRGMAEPRQQQPGQRRSRFGSRVGGAQRWMRRMRLRLAAHLLPYNSGLLAGEALMSPFFLTGRTSHAQAPICVETAFPRCEM